MGTGRHRSPARPPVRPALRRLPSVRHADHRPGKLTGTRARRTGPGRLWFDTPGELAWCVEAMLDPEVRATFSAQGKAYAEDAFGSTDGYIERVLVATRKACSDVGEIGIGGQIVIPGAGGIGAGGATSLPITA